MTPVTFSDLETVQSLEMHEVPVVNVSRASLSCWQLNKEEIDQINKTGKLFLFAYSFQHPSIEITAFNPLELSEKYFATTDFISHVFSSVKVYNENYILMHLKEKKKVLLKEPENGWNEGWSFIYFEGEEKSPTMGIKEKISICGYLDEVNDPEFFKFCYSANKPIRETLLIKRYI